MTCASAFRLHNWQKKYEECFRLWYTDKFLRGERGNACLDEWEVRALLSMPRTFLCKRKMNSWPDALLAGLQGVHGAESKGQESQPPPR